MMDKSSYNEMQSSVEKEFLFVGTRIWHIVTVRYYNCKYY